MKKLIAFWILVWDTKKKAQFNAYVFESLNDMYRYGKAISCFIQFSGLDSFKRED